MRPDPSESDARAKGFDGFSDMMDAKRAGVTDAGIWKTSKAQIMADEDAAKLAAAQVARVAEEQKLAAKAAEEQAGRRHGFHCLSSWDGSHPAFVEAVEERLNDPDSFDHVETVTWPVRPDGRNQIAMTFRATNGFGGVITTSATGTFDNQNCDDVQVESMEQ